MTTSMCSRPAHGPTPCAPLSNTAAADAAITSSGKSPAVSDRAWATSEVAQARSETAGDLPELVIAASAAAVLLNGAQGVGPCAGLEHIEVVIHIHLVSCCHPVLPTRPNREST